MEDHNPLPLLCASHCRLRCSRLRCWRLPSGEAHRAGTESSLWPAASKEMDPANNDVTLDVDASVADLEKTAATALRSQRTQLSHSWIPTLLQKL